MVVITMTSNTRQFQYFGDFNKCPEQSFPSKVLKNFWQYLLDEVAMTQNY